MANYASAHASAHAKIKAAGAAITFSRNEREDYNPEAGTSTITTTSVAGVAMRLETALLGDRKVYDRLGLIESEAPTLLFAADTFMEVPELGMTGTLNGVKYTVRDVAVVAPAGDVIMAQLVISS